MRSEFGFKVVPDFVQHWVGVVKRFPKRWLDAGFPLQQLWSVAQHISIAQQWLKRKCYWKNLKVVNVTKVLWILCISNWMSSILYQQSHLWRMPRPSVQGILSIQNSSRLSYIHNCDFHSFWPEAGCDLYQQGQAILPPPPRWELSLQSSQPLTRYNLTSCMKCHKIRQWVLGGRAFHMGSCK